MSADVLCIHGVLSKVLHTCHLLQLCWPDTVNRILFYICGKQDSEISESLSKIPDLDLKRPKSIKNFILKFLAFLRQDLSMVLIVLELAMYTKLP